MGKGLRGLNLYFAGVNVSCSGTQRSAAGEALTTIPRSRDKHFSTEQLRSFLLLQQLDFQILSSGAMRSAMAQIVERKSC